MEELVSSKSYRKELQESKMLDIQCHKVNSDPYIANYIGYNVNPPRQNQQNHQPVI